MKRINIAAPILGITPICWPFFWSTDNVGASERPPSIPSLDVIAEQNLIRLNFLD